MSKEHEHMAEAVAALSSDPHLLQLIVQRLKREHSRNLHNSRSHQEFKQELASSIDAAIAEVLAELQLSKTLGKFREDLQVRASRTLGDPASNGVHQHNRNSTSAHPTAVESSASNMFTSAAIDSAAELVATVDVPAEDDVLDGIAQSAQEELAAQEEEDPTIDMQPPKFSDSSPSQSKHLVRDLNECELPFVKQTTSPLSSLDLPSHTRAQAEPKLMQRSTDDLVAQADSPNQSQVLEYADDFEQSTEKETNNKRVSFAPGDVTAIHEIREQFTESQAKDLFFSGPLDFFDDDSNAADGDSSDDNIGGHDDVGLNLDSPRYDDDDYVEIDTLRIVGTIEVDDEDAF